MKLSCQSLLALLCGAALFACSADQVEAQSDDDLIGGRLAKPDEFPATLHVRDTCTASKVGPRLVLMAAHCINWRLARGEKIEITSALKTGSFAKKNASGFRAFTIERVEIEPSWERRCREVTCGPIEVAGRNDMADAAVIVVTEDIEGVPEAAVDLSPVTAGDQVVLTGYGCEDKVGGNWSYSGTRQRVAITRVLRFEETIHKNSFILPSDRESGLAGTMDGLYVITPGPAHDAPRDETRAGGLCPGDSGGPLYRAGGNGRTIVGINANYTFSGGEKLTTDGITFTFGGKPMTNWHTRVDGERGQKVGRWLAGLGVNTVCSRGGCD